MDNQKLIERYTSLKEDLTRLQTTLTREETSLELQEKERDKHLKEILELTETETFEEASKMIDKLRAKLEELTTEGVALLNG